MNRYRALPVLLLAALTCGCLGYSSDPLLRRDISSVHVRVFDNTTYWRGFEVPLTRAIQDEIKLRTPFVLANAADADSVLSGKLVGFDLSTQVKGENDEVLLTRVTATVDFRWEDNLTGAPIVPPQTVRESVRVPMLNDPKDPEALALIFQEAAQRVVERMQAPW